VERAGPRFLEERRHHRQRERDTHAGPSPRSTARACSAYGAEPAHKLAAGITTEDDGFIRTDVKNLNNTDLGTSPQG